MQKTVVGVLRGGPSSEYEVSLQSGATVLAELDRAKYEPRDIFITRDGVWHVAGRELPPDRALRGVDVVFNALHGEYGEDGTVQQLLDTFGMPYTGSGALSSAIALSKHRTKETLSPLNIRMPRGVVIEPNTEEDFERASHVIFNSFSAPWVVKPAASGSSVGVTIVQDFLSLEEALRRARQIGRQILVEEFIRGKEATVGVANHYRDEEVYAFFPVEIVPAEKNSFYDYDAKYISDATRYILPGNFTESEKKELMNMAKQVHKHMGLSHYSRSDFIVAPKGIYFLEINTLPGLTSHSLLPKSVVAAGGKLSDFFSHLIELAQKSKNHTHR